MMRRQLAKVRLLLTWLRRVELRSVSERTRLLILIKKDVILSEETMTARIQLPMLAAKLAANVALERLMPGRVTSLKDVPPSAGALTNEWLTAALCREVPDALVVDLQGGGRSDGASSRRALRVEYNAVGNKAGLLTRVFTKTPTRFQSRLM